MDNYRINNVLVHDKFENIANVSEILEKEITSLVKNYLSICDDVIVRYKKDGDHFIFDFVVVADRIKKFGVVR